MDMSNSRPVASTSFRSADTESVTLGFVEFMSMSVRACGIYYEGPDISTVGESLAYRVCSQIKHDVLCALREDLRDGCVSHFAQGLSPLKLSGGMSQLPRYCISEVSVIKV